MKSKFSNFFYLFFEILYIKLIIKLLIKFIKYNILLIKLEYLFVCIIIYKTNVINTK